MGDYEHATIVSADPDTLFRYLSDVEHLPEYMAAMQEAHRTGQEVDEGDEVQVAADVDGVRRQGEAWIATDQERRALRWGSEGHSGYRGELQVEDSGTGSQVTVRLHTERADGPGVRAGLEQTLASIKRLVEGSSTDAVPPR